jgi:thiol-disulfide isomerase/thioredoxin
MKVKTFGQILFCCLYALGPAFSAEFQWIAEKDRVRAKVAGELKTADGKKLSLRDPRSKVTLLNFWATWCSYCKEEMPELMELSKKFSSQGLQIVAATNEDPKVVRRFLEGKDFLFPIVLDLGDTLMDRFKVKTVPATIVIDGEGRIAFRVDSVFKWDSPEVVRALEELLKENKQAKAQ